MNLAGTESSKGKPEEYDGDDGRLLLSLACPWHREQRGGVGCGVCPCWEDIIDVRHARRECYDWTHSGVRVRQLQEGEEARERAKEAGVRRA